MYLHMTGSPLDAALTIHPCQCSHHNSLEGTEVWTGKPKEFLPGVSPLACWQKMQCTVGMTVLAILPKNLLRLLICFVKDKGDNASVQVQHANKLCTWWRFLMVKSGDLFALNYIPRQIVSILTQQLYCYYLWIYLSLYCLDYSICYDGNI